MRQNSLTSEFLKCLFLSQCLDFNFCLSHRVIGLQTVRPTKQEACSVGQHPAQQQQRIHPS